MPFDWLLGRLHRRGAGAARAADAWPAHFVAFDLLRLPGTGATSWPYWRRRAALDSMFAVRRLTAPWILCPSTTHPDVVREWLTWTAFGLEGVVFKRLDSLYSPGARDWLKYKHRDTTEAIVGAVTGPPSHPSTLPLGRNDAHGELQYVGRTTTLTKSIGSTIAPLLSPATGEHPWTGWTFSAGWGSKETLNATLVEPELVVEVSVDVARDAAGHWRHPVRYHRVRADFANNEVPLFGE